MRTRVAVNLELRLLRRCGEVGLKIRPLGSKRRIIYLQGTVSMCRGRHPRLAASCDRAVAQDEGGVIIGRSAACHRIHVADLSLKLDGGICQRKLRTDPLHVDTSHPLIRTPDLNALGVTIRYLAASYGTRLGLVDHVLAVLDQDSRHRSGGARSTRHTALLSTLSTARSSLLPTLSASAGHVA